ncbi:MAG TPA: sodium:solute symporter family protein [Vicinamibacterales bacterium]
MTSTLALLLIFAALQVGVGLFIGRRVRGASDFFVAGRRLPPLLVFATFLAANIGAGSTVGAASYGYRLGVGAWWWNASAGLGSLLLAAWAGPRLWRLAHDRGFLTFGDFLEWRYGRTMRGVAGLLLWIYSLAILAGQLMGASSILQVVAGFPHWVGALLAAAIVLVYFVAGGLLSSAWVNLVQLTFKLTGFVLATVLAYSLAGGWSGFVSATGVPATFTRFGGPDAFWLTTAMLLVPAFIVSPGLVQKAYGADSERAVRIGVGLNGIVLMVFAVCPALLGMAARLRHPDLPSADLALPTLLAVDLPPLVGGLTLAAVLAAEISSADAVLFMLSTSLSRDLYNRFLAPDAPDSRVLAVARAAALAAGVAGVALALVFPTVVDALRAFYSAITVTLLVPVVAALLTRRTAPAEGLASLTSGFAVWLIVLLAGGTLQGVPAQTWGIAGSVVGYAAARALRRP